LKRWKFCADCPQKQERDIFKTDTEQLVFDFLGKTDFQFERFERVLYQTINLSELSPERMTIKTAAMVGVYKAEERRWEKIRDAERKANTPK
jgi:hypothetical protein